MRSATIPAPRSRFAATRTATAARSAASASAGNSMAASSAAKGRTAAIQPNGESQRASPPMTSPAPRSRKQAATTAIATPVAPRAVRMSCPVTAASDAPSSPVIVICAPASVEPRTPAPVPMNPEVTMAPASREPAAVTTSTATSGAARPIAADPDSSLVPSSSVARVFRTTVKTDARLMKIVAAPRIRHSSTPPGPTLATGPMMNNSPALRLTEAASASRLARVGYVEAIPAATSSASSAVSTYQADPCTRSRRSTRWRHDRSPVTAFTRSRPVGSPHRWHGRTSAGRGPPVWAGRR